MRETIEIITFRDKKWYTNNGDFMTIKEMLQQLKYEEITPIQKGVFDAFQHDKHLVGLAPTGTGKTHAYLLPILANINANKSHVQAVITVPTNELVHQVYKMLRDADESISTKAYYAGTDKQKELAWLSKHQPQVVIATPARLMEYALTKYALNIQTASWVVMDEADMMFDESFLSQIDLLLPLLKHAKLMLFSATITQQMSPFIKAYFGHYDFIDTLADHDLDINYQLINIKHRDRLEALLAVLKHINPYLALIFVSKKDDQERIFQAIYEDGYSVTQYSSKLGIKRRKQLLDEVHALKYQYVVTSDVAARGLDFDASHVIHFDLPNHLEFYFHRSGRTGRMNKHGVVITFLDVNDHRQIEKLRQKIDFDDYTLSGQTLSKKKDQTKNLSVEEIQAIKKIKKPKQIKPNYKKKNKKAVKKAIKDTRRKTQYAKNRKSR